MNTFRNLSLSDSVIALLKPYFPDFDLSAIRVHEGIPWYVIGKPTAFTLGNDIYFAPGFYDPESPSGIALIAHEALHAQEYRRLGKMRMASGYLREYFAGRLRRLGHAGAYEAISHERAAFALQDRVYADLLAGSWATMVATSGESPSGSDDDE